MKKFFKNNLYIVLTLLFLFLLFKNNRIFKTCILNGSILFFESVFPSLFPMFIINDILINYNFFSLFDKLLGRPLKKIFHTSSAANYCFIMSLFSGTPTNGYIVTNLVKEKKLNIQDASLILSYAFFLNPLFLYNMLNSIFPNTNTPLKIISIHYGINFLIALFCRKHNYTEETLGKEKTPLPFTKILKESIERSFSTLLMILGTIIFYFMICEGIHIFVKSPLLDCITNGLLEATGGLSKLITLQSNYKLKEILASLFISFGGLSIHTQIKSITTEENISYKHLLKGRLVSTCLSTLLTCIIP